MNNFIKSYISFKYNDYSIIDKEDGNSDGFILEKASSMLNRVYFKSDPGYLVDHFVLSIFARVAVKAPESKIHYIKGGKTGVHSSNFYLSTNGMSRSYQKKGILKTQIYTDFFPAEKLTKDQVDQFRVSLAKLRLLTYVFGLSDIRDENLGYLEKKNPNGSTTFKLGIVDFVTPVTDLAPDFYEMFSQECFIEALNHQAKWVLLSEDMKNSKPVKLTLEEYRRAFYSLSHPTMKEFNDEGYLVSNSLGEKTKFETVVENVFNDIQTEYSMLESMNEMSFKNLSDYLCKIKKYKNVILSRFQDAEAIMIGRSMHRFINILISEIIIPWAATLLLLRTLDFGIQGSIPFLALLLLYWAATQNHFITTTSVKGPYQAFCDSWTGRGTESGVYLFEGIE